MAAVAVLRNDSLQAFLQVRAGPGEGGSRWESVVRICAGTLSTLNLKRPSPLKVRLESDLGAPMPT